jgi:hypothetical protein
MRGELYRARLTACPNRAAPRPGFLSRRRLGSRRRPQDALELLNLLADERRRIRELLRARRRGAEAEGSIGLERAGELVEPASQLSAGCSRGIVGRARRERCCLGRKRLDLAGHDRSLAEDLVQCDEGPLREVIHR